MKNKVTTFLLASLLLVLSCVSTLAQLQKPPRSVVVTSATYSDKTQYDEYEVDATSNAVTLTLIAPAKRRTVAVFKTDASANAVTVATAGTGATINGSSTYTISNQYEGVLFVSNGLSGSSGAWRAYAKQSVTGSDISIASQARGDIIRRNASSWGRLSAKTLSSVLVGDGTDVVSSPIATLTDSLLSTTDSVNLNTATATTLYTCPTGKTCVITAVVVRNASTSLTTVSVSFGWNSTSFNDVVANATHTELTGSTLYTRLTAKTGATAGTSTGTFKVLDNTLQGGAATASIDVFGYVF
jgi:hypothetical protein